MKLLALLILLISNISYAALKVGDTLPALKGKNQDSKIVETKNYEKNYLLVYFYPKADTPGCTKQACSIRDAFATLQKEGIAVLGVSTDDVEDQKHFKKKYRLPFDLIADTKEEWAKAFDVPVRLGFASRQAFLFQDGKLVWFDTSASTEEQAKDVLEVVNKQKNDKKP